MLDKEHEGYLRELCEGILPEEDLQKLANELTNEEFWARVDNLRQGIDQVKREHYQERRRVPRRRRR